MINKNSKMIGEPKSNFNGSFKFTISYSLQFHKKYLELYPFLYTLDKYLVEKYGAQFIIDFDSNKYNYLVERGIYFSVENTIVFIHGNNLKRLKEIAIEAEQMRGKEEQTIIENSNIYI